MWVLALAIVIAAWIIGGSIGTAIEKAGEEMVSAIENAVSRIERIAEDQDWS